MEWERAAWVGGLALMSAGLAGGVAIAASKQAPPSTVGPPPPVTKPPPVTTTTTTTPIPSGKPPKTLTPPSTSSAPTINYQNVTLVPTTPDPVTGAQSDSLQDVRMLNPTQLTIQLPPGATWSAANPVPKSPWPSSISNVVYHTSGDAPWVMTFSGTIGNLDDVLTIRWIDSTGREQESQLTLIAIAPPSIAPKDRPPKTTSQQTLVLKPGTSGLTGSAPWVSTVSVPNPTQLTIQLPPGGTWNGNGNPLQGGALGLNLTAQYPGGSITNVTGSQLSGNSPISFLFSGVVGKVSYILTLNWTDVNLRSQQAQLSLMATA